MVKFGMVTFLKNKHEQVIIVLLDLEKVIIKKGKKGHLGPTRTGRKKRPMRSKMFLQKVVVLERSQGRYKIAYYQPTTFAFQSIFICYLTLHFGTETLSKQTNAPVGELYVEKYRSWVRWICKHPWANAQK